MKKSIIYIIMCTALLSACQDENTFGPDFKPDKMGHMMKMDQSDIAFQAAGGSQTVQVKAKGPHWKFTGSPEWLTISPSEGSGDRSVTFTATENTATAERTATLRFESDERDFSHAKPFTVRQAGVARHTTVTATPLSFATDGGSQDIAVTSNEEWTATVTPAEAVWCSVSPSTATGNGTVTVTATENKTFDARSATITIKGKTSGDEVKVSVTQTGTKPVTTATPTTLPEFTAAGGESTIAVTSNEEWTATVTPAEAVWCSVSPSTATGNGTLTVTAAENETIDTRSATITFKGKTSGDESKVSVTQRGVEPYINVSPTSIEFEQTPTASQTVTVTCNESWTAESNATWCKVGNTTTTSFTVMVETNQSFSARTATITVTTTRGKTATISVTQKGGTIDYEDYDEDETL